jgi:hypothetical protein
MHNLSKKRLLELRLARVNRLIEEQKELDKLHNQQQSNSISNTITNLK